MYFGRELKEDNFFSLVFVSIISSTFLFLALLVLKSIDAISEVPGPAIYIYCFVLLIFVVAKEPLNHWLLKKQWKSWVEEFLLIFWIIAAAAFWIASELTKGQIVFPSEIEEIAKYVLETIVLASVLKHVYGKKGQNIKLIHEFGRSYPKYTVMIRK